MKLVVKDIKRETKEAVSISFKNGNLFKKIKYKPGQFMSIYVPVNGKTEKRMYSFSSNPYTDKDLKITVKEVFNGLVSSYLCNNVKVGDSFDIEDPQGSFFVEPQNKVAQQYVLFAGGSGITPIFSIIKSVLTHEPESKIVLIYANKNQDSIIFHEEIKQIAQEYPNAFQVEHILSEETVAADNYHTGLANLDLYQSIFDQHQLGFNHNKYMICGPFGFMEKTKEILLSKDVKRNEIIIEVFKTPEIKTLGKEQESEVTLKFNGQTHQLKVLSNQTILKVAMANNIALPYSCRSGMCSTCKASCTEGEIQMTEGHFLPENEVDGGKILTCISYPKTPTVTIEI